jgi:hypothetical protein
MGCTSSSLKGSNPHRDDLNPQPLYQEEVRRTSSYSRSTSHSHADSSFSNHKPRATHLPYLDDQPETPHAPDLDPVTHTKSNSTHPSVLQHSFDTSQPHTNNNSNAGKKDKRPNLRPELLSAGSEPLKTTAEIRADAKKRHQQHWAGPAGPGQQSTAWALLGGSL